MNKYSVMPQVVVYKDLLDPKDVSRFLSILKKSETDVDGFEVIDPGYSSKRDMHGVNPEEREEFGPINTWVPWYNYGTKTFISNKQPNLNILNEDIEFAYKFRDHFSSVLTQVFNDYRSEWSNSGYWAEYINDWSIKDIESQDGRFVYSVTEVLKHSIFPEKEFALHFHTDSHEHRIESPRQQQVITFTLYLNDNYDGGEIQFIDENNEKLITYKPKAGDITVFPSGPPYWHSALSVKEGDNKYFFRLFMLWEHPGTKEWWEGFNKYGAEEWEKINNQKMFKDLDSGNRDRQVVREGQQPSNERSAVPFYVKKENEFYVDGRSI